MHHKNYCINAGPAKYLLAVGYTLVELLIVVAIVVLLGSIAFPSFLEFIDRENLRSRSIEFSDSVKVARSAAVKSGTPVVMCASQNGSTCSGGWAGGWFIFQDDSRDNSPDAGERVLRRSKTSDGRTSVTVQSATGDFLTFFRFNYRGAPGPAITVNMSRGSKTAGLGINAFGKPHINGH